MPNLKGTITACPPSLCAPHGLIEASVPCVDFASKSELHRGRTRRRILNWLKRRAARRLPPERTISRVGMRLSSRFGPKLPVLSLGDPLAHGIQFRSEDGLLYIEPTPASR